MEWTRETAETSVKVDDNTTVFRKEYIPNKCL
jgi:hypothetical protein